MITTSLQALLPLVLALIGVLGLCIYVFLKSPAGYYLKFAVVPLGLVLGLFSYIFVSSLLGYAFPNELPTKFAFIAYNVVIKDNRKVGLEIWYHESKDRTRLSTAPYSKEMEKQLQQALAAASAGKMAMFERKKRGQDGEGSSSGSDSSGYQVEILEPQDVTPKAPIDDEAPQGERPQVTDKFI